MNILLLGGTGYLGGNITKYLTTRGHQVFCVVRNSSDISRLRTISGIKLISNEPGQINLTFVQEQIDWVINAVCTYKPNASLYGDMLQSNVIFPLSVLNLAIQHQVRNFMTMGTGLPDEFNVYSFTKAKFSDFGRFLSRHDGINFVDLRLELFYGGWCEPDKRFLRACKLKLEHGEPLLLTTGVQKRDIIRVEDIVALIDRLLTTHYVQGYRALPVGTGEQHTIREIVGYMREQMQSKSELRFGAVPSRKDEPDTLADVAWYREIDFSLQYDYYAGLRAVCLN